MKVREKILAQRRAEKQTEAQNAKLFAARDAAIKYWQDISANMQRSYGGTYYGH